MENEDQIDAELAQAQELLAIAKQKRSDSEAQKLVTIREQLADNERNKQLEILAEAEIQRAAKAKMIARQKAEAEAKAQKLRSERAVQAELESRFNAQEEKIRLERAKEAEVQRTLNAAFLEEQNARTADAEAIIERNRIKAEFDARHPQVAKKDPNYPDHPLARFLQKTPD